MYLWKYWTDTFKLKDYYVEADDSIIATYNTIKNAPRKIIDYVDITDDNNNVTRQLNVSGNIGVSTSQQMIESEMELRAKYDIYKIISREFEREFLVQIY